MKNKSIVSILALALIAVSCGNKGSNENISGQGISLENFDTSVSPRTDFFRYVNGNWLKNNPIPESESMWGNFNIIRDQNKNNLKSLVEEAANTATLQPGSVKKKIGDFYFTAMDSLSLNKEGINPLKEEFSGIDAMKDKKEIPAILARQHRIGTGTFFVFYAEPDFKNTSVMISNIYQAGLGLPDRDYYLMNDPASETIRKEYSTHVTKMFELIGDKSASASAAMVMRMETALASASMSRVVQRNPDSVYHKMTVAELNALSPVFAWDQYFKVLGMNEQDVNVGQPEFIRAMGKLLESSSLENCKTYMRWQLIHAMAPYLSGDIVSENFRMYGTVLNGAKKMKSRWNRALDAIDRSLGEALGQIYVEKFFTPESKKKVNELVDNLTFAFRERINTREWMSPETKKQAQAKLETFMRKLAYPDTWRDYSGLEIERDAYVRNVIRANEFEFKRGLAKLGKPVDKMEWQMSPPTVNAYYNPLFNEIVFPAGIMQSPFFNPNADDAVNYGAIGAIIGHELSHGFDDQGCQFDKDGNLKNWWTDQDKIKFKKRTTLLVAQFNSYTAIDTLHVNGELTLGENIADLGGLTIAYYAFKKSLEGKGEQPKIDGFTPEQRFFISWAQGWRSHMRPDALKQMIITNPHSPGNFRVLGPLSNMKEFYEAFGVKEGDAMYRDPAKRVEIW